jgi:hypothetical protein
MLLTDIPFFREIIKARMVKYYKRTPTGQAKRKWRYYYTRAEYEREHGHLTHEQSEEAGHEKGEVYHEEHPAPAVDNGIKIEKYSDKSISLSGDTKKYLDVIQGIRRDFKAGFWLAKQKLWIFPTAMRGQIEERFRQNAEQKAKEQPRETPMTATLVSEQPAVQENQKQETQQSGAIAGALEFKKGDRVSIAWHSIPADYRHQLLGNVSGVARNEMKKDGVNQFGDFIVFGPLLTNDNSVVSVSPRVGKNKGKLYDVPASSLRSFTPKKSNRQILLEDYQIHSDVRIKNDDDSIRRLTSKLADGGIFDDEFKTISRNGYAVAVFKNEKTKQAAEKILQEFQAWQGYNAPGSESSLNADSRSEAMKGNQNAAGERKVKRVVASEKRKIEKRAKPDKDVAKKILDENKWDSENFRFRDTGYIAGSRKERASEIIQRLSREGKQVSVSQIDWDELEKNPREAQTIIQKSNLFGTVDWESLKRAGMDPAAGFLLDRVYASIPTIPAENSGESRYYYTMALQSLRKRLEVAKTPADVTDIIGEIQKEKFGFVLTDEESAKMDIIREKQQSLRDEKDKWEAVKNSHYDRYNKADRAAMIQKYEISKRRSRGWKIQNADIQKLAELERERNDLWEKHREFLESSPEYFSREHLTTPYEQKIEALYSQLSAIKAIAQLRHQQTDVYRSWAALGEKFDRVLNYKNHRGSKTFVGHVASAKSGLIKDWSWQERGNTGPKKVSERGVAFQLQVAETFSRTGGRPVRADSTTDLKQKFGLRDVQTGDWVKKDITSAAFHVQKSAEAFADLADLLKISDEDVSLDGELAIAFGARGNGNAGWQGAAAAHYEKKLRVINMTKMSGGGSLAHEWFHAVDNLLGEMEAKISPRESKWNWEEFATRQPSQIQDHSIREAVINLRRAILEGDVDQTTEFSYTSKHYDLAQANMSRNISIVSDIKSAGDLGAALAAIRKRYPIIQQAESPDGALELERSKFLRKQLKQAKSWVNIAIAHYGGKPSGGSIRAATGKKVSSFLSEAEKLDVSKPYWSTTEELSARAFQAYVEDRLEEKGLKNDYLSWGADNAHYALFNEKPFPEGEERERINKAFDELFEVFRKTGVLKRMAQVAKTRRLLLSEIPGFQRILKSEKLVGGDGDGRPDAAFDPADLEAAVQHEMREHGHDRRIATELAKDHLTEDPDYYRKLAKIERKKSFLLSDSPAFRKIVLPDSVRKGSINA